MSEEKYKAVVGALKEKGTVFPIEGGFLVPISFQYKTQMPDCVHLLSQWRIENPSLSPTRFPVSDERTERWLQANVLGNDSRIMFMIQSPERQNVGHIGLSGMDVKTQTVRFDSAMKGVKDKCPGIMRTVFEFLKVWCREQLEARFVDLVVLDDNVRAIRLYEKCEFEVISSIPLRKIEHDGEINWEEDMSLEKPEKCFLHMVCRL